MKRVSAPRRTGNGSASHLRDRSRTKPHLGNQPHIMGWCGGLRTRSMRYFRIPCQYARHCVCLLQAAIKVSSAPGTWQDSLTYAVKIPPQPRGSDVGGCLETRTLCSHTGGYDVRALCARQRWLTRRGGRPYEKPPASTAKGSHGPSGAPSFPHFTRWRRSPVKISRKLTLLGTRSERGARRCHSRNPETPW